MAFSDGPLKNLKVPLTWAAGAAVALALAGALALLLTDRRGAMEGAVYSPVRETVDRVQGPVSGALAAPGRWIRGGVNGVRGYFGAVGENRRLRAELEEMNELEAELASLKDLNARYIELLGLRTDPPLEMVSGRAISDSRGPFANSRLINVGTEAGVKVGQPVMSENGLVGRIVGTTNGISRVLLLTDVASRTPVMIDRTNARAILQGDGGPNPTLSYLRTRDPPQAGDVVVTSGDGGLMPRGLPVGVVVKGLEGGWRVRLASDRSPVDFVRVLKFESFAQLADTERLTSPVPPQEMGGTTPAAAAPAEPAPSSTPAAPTRASPPPVQPPPQRPQPAAPAPQSEPPPPATPQPSAQPAAPPAAPATQPPAEASGNGAETPGEP